jgi:A/G-specific adenine glycosylase
MSVSDAILKWYDVNARILPWRIAPYDRACGVMPNPYHVWVSEMMLQQTTVATVINYYNKFITKWPSVYDLAQASQDEIMTEWAGLGYYSRARNLHKTAQTIMQHYQGVFPDNEQELIKLAGIGRYSAASISAIAFDKPAAVMDGNIERIVTRLFCIKNPLPASKKELYQLVKTLTPQMRSGDYAQAMMDLGASVCTPKKPLCKECPLQNDCQAYQTDNPEIYPVKTPKIQKPTHKGIIFLLIDSHHHILVEKRPNSGLFGGMDIFPYMNPHEMDNRSENNGFSIKSILKTVDKIVDKCDVSQDSFKVIGHIKHVFTHFNFHADVLYIPLQEIKPINNKTTRLVKIDQLHTIALPTLMKKTIKFIKKYIY